MEKMRLGRSPLMVSRIALGCMRLSDDPAQAKMTVRAALDRGIDFFDHADIYGRGLREEVFSAIWEGAPGLRERVFLQSKCGIRFAGDTGPDAPTRYDFSYEHITRAVDGSLDRLKTDYLDVLLLHRPDALVEPEEVARAFDEVQRKGKVRFFGVSNHTAAQIQLLQTCVDQPLVANQVQLSVVHTQMINDGIVFNRDEAAPPSRSEGTLAFCRMQGITLQAWSPLAAGAVTGKPVTDVSPRIERTAAVVRALAEERGVSQEAIVIAWLLRHPAGIQPIIGTTNPARIAACCQADELALTREEWYRLFEAGRGGRVP
ncbi:MAG: aldo/keto reductase family oxidoreductase [Anaerolineae bacterium]